MSDSKRLHFDIEINEDNFSKIYDLYGPMLFGIITRMAGDTNLSEDILYKTFLNIWAKRNNFNPAKETLFIWMTGIARRLSMELLKAARSSESEDEILRKLIFNTKVERYISGKIDIEKIDEMDKAALKFIFMNGFSWDQLAGKLNVPVEILKFKVRTAATKITGYNG